MAAQDLPVLDRNSSSIAIEQPLDLPPAIRRIKRNAKTREQRRNLLQRSRQVVDGRAVDGRRQGLADGNDPFVGEYLLCPHGRLVRTREKRTYRPPMHSEP
jgi:hypothetical protein